MNKRDIPHASLFGKSSMNCGLLTMPNLMKKMRRHFTLMPIDLSANSCEVLEQSLTMKLSTKSYFSVLEIPTTASLSQLRNPFGRVTMTTRTILMWSV
jgi:hypothetical protein